MRGKAVKKNKKQQDTDFKRFIMINTDNSMNIFIQRCINLNLAVGHR